MSRLNKMIEHNKNQGNMPNDPGRFNTCAGHAKKLIANYKDDGLCPLYGAIDSPNCLKCPADSSNKFLRLMVELCPDYQD